MIGFLIRKVFLKKLTSKLTDVELTENGFSINEPFGAKPKLYNWSEIKSIHFSENKKEVIIEKSENQIVLKNHYTGWYEFIQNVPTKFLEFDFDYAKSVIDSLKPCKVCGIVALKENECIVCENIPWNSKMAETEINYIKSKQLELYSERIKDKHEIKNIAEPEHGFKADKNWKLYI